MKKFVIPFLFFMLLGVNNFASAETVWADDSIDEVIIKQYDTKAIEKEFLPDLPESLKKEGNDISNLPKVDTSAQEQPSTITKTIHKTATQPKTSQKTSKNSLTTINNTDISKDYVYVKKGTKFRLRIEQPIDDSAKIGTKVYFTSLYPEINNFITIPKGTKFIGTVTDSHLPQATANGGLLVITVDKMIYKEKTYPITTTVVMVGNKRVYQNNIKGKHKYWQSVGQAIKPGANFYSKVWQSRKKVAGDALEIVLTPVAFVGGAIGFAGNAIASPAIALFAKGGRLFIKKGTYFELKLLKDTAVRL